MDMYLFKKHILFIILHYFFIFFIYLNTFLIMASVGIRVESKLFAQGYANSEQNFNNLSVALLYNIELYMHKIQLLKYINKIF